MLRGGRLRGEKGGDLRQLSNESLIARIFETVPYPTFLVDQEVHVLHANTAAARLLAPADPHGGTAPRRLGDLLRCDRATRSPGGCGSSRDCDACPIRGAVRRALRGEIVRRNLAFVAREENGRKREICFLVSAAAIDHERRKLAVVTLEDVTEIFHLRSKTPHCSACGRTLNP